MAWRGGLTRLGGTLVLATAMLAPAKAAAQEPAPTEAQRFGQRDAFVVSVERMFGFVNLKLSEDGGNLESKGLHPVLWGNLGLFGMTASGLNYGATLGATRIQLDSPNDESASLSLFQVRPRIGYAGTEKEGRFGYWVRGGPNLILVFDDDSNSQLYGLGFEAYAVFFPAPHVGIVAGPHADFHLARSGDSDSAEYKSYGLTAGILGEFY